MQIQEELTAARNELNIYKKELEKCNAEKISLDKLFVQTLQEKVKLMTKEILDEVKIKNLNEDILVLNKEKSALQCELDKLKSSSVEKEVEVLIE